MSGDARAWKLTLPCTREEAEAIALADIDLAAVLMTTEVDPDGASGAAGEWRLDAYFDGEPEPATVAAIRELAASGGWSRARPAPLPDEDWVTLSQAGLEPIREGRFVVHTGAHRIDPPPGGRAFRIDAGLAFGTGHHHTTAGCLAMLEALADRRFDRAIDLGTGTGLLAFAARHLWPAAIVLATDIDPTAIAVTRENADANDVPAIELVVADGARAAAIAGRAPYDLIIANILAGPLIAMAPEIAAIAAPGASIVLAGLLTSQAEAVAAAYAAQGVVREASETRGDWTIVRLSAGATPVGAAPPGDRGGWGATAEPFPRSRVFPAASQGVARMEIVKLPIGEGAPVDSDCISIDELSDGSFGLMGSLLSNDGSVAIVKPIICPTREAAEEQGMSWAAECDVATLYVATTLRQ